MGVLHSALPREALLDHNLSVGRDLDDSRLPNLGLDLGLAVLGDGALDLGLALTLDNHLEGGG